MSERTPGGVLPCAKHGWKQPCRDCEDEKVYDALSGRLSSPPASLWRRTVARISRSTSVGYGRCYRCGMSWKYAASHTTWYGDGGRGCFPLCESCWADLTPEQRLPFYERLLYDWHAEKPVESGQAEAIIRAVMADG